MKATEFKKWLDSYNPIKTKFSMDSESVQETQITSKILILPGEKPLNDAIAKTLQAPNEIRVELFKRLVHEIEMYIVATAPEHPWTCTVYVGTDGSHIFRGGVGHSLVIDPQGRLWRARSYEDFDTTYCITENSCIIDSLKPLYHQMREYC
jgi:hypothetical protein